MIVAHQETERRKQTPFRLPACLSACLSKQREFQAGLLTALTNALGAELKSPVCQASLIKLLAQLGDPDPEHALHTIK